MWLGALAHYCHVSPREVDQLRIHDFARLVMWTEEFIKAQKKQAEAQ